jgi:hypothetical protein
MYLRSASTTKTARNGRNKGFGFQVGMSLALAVWEVVCFYTQKGSQVFGVGTPPQHVFHAILLFLLIVIYIIITSETKS